MGTTKLASVSQNGSCIVPWGHRPVRGWQLPKLAAEGSSEHLASGDDLSAGLQGLLQGPRLSQGPGLQPFILLPPVCPLLSGPQAGGSFCSPQALTPAGKAGKGRGLSAMASPFPQLLTWGLFTDGSVVLPGP